MDRAQFTAQELAAVVDEAHASGLPVTAHAHALVAIRAAVAAGVDGIEHFTFLTAEGVHMAEDVLAAVAAQGIVVCPTLGRVPGAVPPPGLRERMRKAGLDVDARAEQVVARRPRLKRPGTADPCRGGRRSRPHAFGVAGAACLRDDLSRQTASPGPEARGRGGMVLHLRLICPPDRTDEARALLDESVGVAHIVEFRGAAVRPAGDVVEADVARECVDELLTDLTALSLDHDGAITLEALETVLSDAADAAEEAAPGQGADAVVWDELVSRTGEDSRLTAGYQTFLTIACLLAAIGAIADSPVTVVGAMCWGPSSARWPRWPSAWSCGAATSLREVQLRSRSASHSPWRSPRAWPSCST